MNSSTKLPSYVEPTPEQLAEALDLLRDAQEADRIATEKLLKAEAAFRAIGKSLPLFDSLASAHQRDDSYWRGR